eukprot:TRINITY_DN109147_c0_g1_i1.p1 TRINITY_DN109147_c0_g1~~TRINITY_DN109147_c0_g1_i1.p1  ORF type:complete len:195 (-),score=24.37 TRINITY_DN109147_c0_g1_i1:124-624(-)
MDRGCHFFTVNSLGDCATFSSCSGDADPQQVQVFEYRLRTALLPSNNPIPESSDGRPFILGTILHGNKVLINDTHNPQWNNRQYSQDLGVGVYPPYPEASGYAISAGIAAFLAGVGEGALSSLAWKAWAIEDAAMGTLLAGLDLDFLLLPLEVRNRIRVIKVPKTS